MNVHQPISSDKRQTTADEVFLQLKSDIISLRMAPGSKLSEAEIARRYDVSRQPVREAFMRLGDLDLLQIRPQKATIVRKISLQDLANTRFIRAAVEVEVVRVACRFAKQENLALLLSNLEAQRDAARADHPLGLQVLDYEFHRLICVAAERLPAFKTIAENKAHTDRVCTLELSDAVGMAEVLEDHTDIYEAILRRDEEAAVALTRHHLEHLDDTLTKARTNHPDFFQE
ncbi:MAG: GntR family transcriptional regulator [Pseudomonadota bacterium]